MDQDQSRSYLGNGIELHGGIFALTKTDEAVTLGLAPTSRSAPHFVNAECGKIVDAAMPVELSWPADELGRTGIYLNRETGTIAQFKEGASLDNEWSPLFEVVNDALDVLIVSPATEPVAVT